MDHGGSGRTNCIGVKGSGKSELPPSASYINECLEALRGKSRTWKLLGVAEPAELQLNGSRFNSLPHCLLEMQRLRNRTIEDEDDDGVTNDATDVDPSHLAAIGKRRIDHPCRLDI